MPIQGAISCAIADGVATVTLSRGKYNALTERMVSQLHDVVRDVALDDQVRVVVLTGAGRSFCPGADLVGPRVNNTDVV